MRSSASLSSGRVRSIRSPLVLATRAASASRGLMDFATSRGVVPLGTSFVLPSGSLIWMLSAMGCFRVYHRPRRGGCPHPPSRARRISRRPRTGRAALACPDEGVRAYVGSKTTHVGAGALTPPAELLIRPGVGVPVPPGALPFFFHGPTQRARLPPRNIFAHLVTGA